MLNENYAEKSGKYKQIAGLPVDNTAESGIIKPITVDDIATVDKDGTISDECKEAIASTIEKFQKDGHKFSFDAVRMVNISPNRNGGLDVLRTNAIDSGGYPKVVLEINYNRRRLIMIPVFVFDCVYCKNSHKDDKHGLVCGAYPDGFPEEIVHSKIEPHKLKECGNGFKFEDTRIKKKTLQN